MGAAVNGLVSSFSRINATADSAVRDRAAALDLGRAARAQVAGENHDGPTVLVLSRQHLPTLDRRQFAPAEQLCRGAYVLNRDVLDPGARLDRDRIRGLGSSPARHANRVERGRHLDPAMAINVCAAVRPASSPAAANEEHPAAPPLH